MKITHTTRLTDNLERELLAHAMEEQFRPRPLRAVSKLFNGLIKFTTSARAKTTMGQMI